MQVSTKKEIFVGRYSLNIQQASVVDKCGR